MIFSEDERENVLPRFRESAYTKIKQEIGEETPESIKEMERNIEDSALKAIQKREKLVKLIRANN